MRDLDTISEDIVVAQKKLKELTQSQHIVEDKILHLQKDILNKQSEKKELEIIAGKGRHNIRQLNIDLKLLTAEFWNAKQ